MSANRPQLPNNLNVPRCECMYRILGVARSEILAAGASRRDKVEEKATLARTSMHHCPSTIDNMRSKERGYKMVELSQLVVCDQRIEDRYWRAMASNVCRHDCAKWLETANFISLLRSELENHPERRRVHDDTEPDSTTS